jgi:hypothetical protein
MSISRRCFQRDFPQFYFVSFSNRRGCTYKINVAMVTRTRIGEVAGSNILRYFLICVAFNYVSSSLLRRILGLLLNGGLDRIRREVSLLVSWVLVRLSPLGTSATNWPIAPAPDDR